MPTVDEGGNIYLRLRGAEEGVGPEGQKSTEVLKSHFLLQKKKKNRQIHSGEPEL